METGWKAEAFSVNQVEIMSETLEHTIKHEFPYRQNIVFCLVMPVLFGCLTAACLYWALTDDGDVVVHGLQIAGIAATAIRWASVALMSSLFITGVFFLWGRIVRPEQRITITADGIRMPRNRWKSEAEFLRFDEIEGVSVTRHRGHVTFVNIHSANGKFSVSRQMLTRQDFEEVTRIIEERIRQSTERGF